MTCVRYTIRTGAIDLVQDDGSEACLGHGYSGNGSYRDDASQTTVRGHGPIPVGRYKIGAPFDSPHTGVFTLPLDPQPGTEMFGRSLIRMHGDNPEHDFTASDGCIVAPPEVRHAVAQYQDLEVVPG